MVRRPRYLTLLAAVLLLCFGLLIGCGHGASVATPATAPADPYATALQRLQVFAGVLQDANTTAATLHGTYLVQSDGTTALVLDDGEFARVQAALRFAAVEGTTLSNLLSQRASAATITSELAKVTAGLAQQLAPETVGIKDPQSQQRYILLVNLVHAGVVVLANQFAALLPQEQSLGPSRSDRPRELAYGTRAAYSIADCSGAEGMASVAADRPLRAARVGQCELRPRAHPLMLYA